MDQAFTLSAKLFGNDTVVVNWKIAPKHYLYRERFSFKVIQPPNASIGSIILPAGEPKEDEIFGKYQVYKDSISIPIPIINVDPHSTVLKVSYQGCSEDGYCYPPASHMIKVNFATQTVSLDTPTPNNKLNQQEPFLKILNNDHLYMIILAFLGFGILLSFTPCVLPMLPILSGIIVGHQQTMSTGKAFRLSLVYTHQKSGHYIGAAIMGCLSTLIVSPCVTPALVGVLGYIGQTGDAAIGGIALFSLGLGMGIPLIIVGSAGGKLLPKAGMWMKTLESVFGVFFIALAIWILDRILPGPVSLMLWAAFLMINSVYLGAFSATSEQNWHKLWKGIGLVLFTYGILLLIGATQGNSNPLQPISINAKASSEAAKANTLFTQVQNTEQVQQAINLAKAQKKPVMLDFYADWCISCKEMEQTTFKDSAVQTAMADFITLQANVTKNDANDKNLLENFGVIAPPTMLFFDTNGKALTQLTLVGKTDANEFVAHLKEVLKES